MSYAATHKHHRVHVPWTTVIALAVAVVACATVLVLVNQPATQTSTGQAEVAPVAVTFDAAAVPLPENQAARRHLAAKVQAQAVQTEQFTYPRNHVMGATAGTFAASASAPPRLAAETAPNDPHPFNHFPGEP